ncbi:MAG: mechanosensitive ion channel family protein, partial [Clostridia bacterium]|nr:mechanosensitive ion channel family protein [Clostridia bacterium]
YLCSFLKALLSIVVLLTAVGVMGIPMTTIITVIASAGVAISLAMQGALSNFVGGITILILKPMRSGDYVKIGDTEGTVQKIGTLYTEFVTPDNRHISLPNASLTNTAIINYNREGTRRLDVNFSVAYDTDIDSAKKVLGEVIGTNVHILKKPAAEVILTNCGENALVLTMRVWVRTSDYWSVNFDLIDRGKKALDSNHIHIPFPQMDVHIKQ